MGSDYGCEFATQAAELFIKNNKDVSIKLFGNNKEIEKYIKNNKNIEIIDCSEVVHATDNVLSILRNTKSSMYTALQYLKDNKVDGVITAGSTGPYVLLSSHILKKIDGVSKPAFMSYLPTSNAKGFMMLDVGANLTCDAIDLKNFAIMANIYSQEIRKISKPTIGVLNIGTEDNKGFEYHIQANQLLKKEKKLNYIGFVEPRELLDGKIDIVVCDGYSGNLTLKALEGSLLTINNLLKKEYKKPLNIFGALLSMGVIKKIKKNFNYKNYAGAFVVGLEKNIVKTHGSAKVEEWTSALRMLKESISINLVEKIKKSL